jgi:hypothetical protein
MAKSETGAKPYEITKAVDAANAAMVIKQTRGQGAAKGGKK